MNAVAKIPLDDNRLVDIMRDSLYPGAKPESVRMVLSYCQARGLDPLRKPVHLVPVWVKNPGGKGGQMQDVVMPGIALYRIEAARTNQYAGKTEPVFGPEQTRTLDGKKVTFPAWCRVTVSRIVGGQRCDFTAVEYWLENYATAGRESEAPNAMWTKRAYGQLAKCAEAQALRMAFPEATGGEPTAEEMEGKTFGDAPREVPNLHRDEPPAPTLAAEVAAARATLPVIAPSGTLHQVPRERWLAAIGKAVGGLEDAMAMKGWGDAMAEHLATARALDDALAHQAEQVIAGRIFELAGPPEPEPGATEPEDDAALV